MNYRVSKWKTILIATIENGFKAKFFPSFYSSHRMHDSHWCPLVFIMLLAYCMIQCNLLKEMISYISSHDICALLLRYIILNSTIVLLLSYGQPGKFFGKVFGRRIWGEKQRPVKNGVKSANLWKPFLEVTYKKISCYSSVPNLADCLTVRWCSPLWQIKHNFSQNRFLY